MNEEKPLDKITDVLLYTDDYDDDEVQSVLKLFGRQMSTVYNFIDERGEVGNFLNIYNNVFGEEVLT